MTLIVGCDPARPERFPCDLYRCEAMAAPEATMCRKHWRIVPMPLQAQIRRALASATQVDPRRNRNAQNSCKILASKAKVAVLAAQGKRDALNDELARMARLDPKSARAPSAIDRNPSKRSSRGSRRDVSAGN